MKSQRGQAFLEMILLIAVILTLWHGIVVSLTKSQVFDTIFTEPWARLKNTIEFGVPTNKDVTEIGKWHPASVDRHSTRLAQEPPPQ